MESARRQFDEPRALWRHLYGMPINDPRALEATDDEVLEDLLIRFFQRRASDAAADPAIAAQQYAEEHPEEAIRVIHEHDAWLKSADTQARLRKLWGQEGEPTAPIPATRAGTLRRRVRP